VDVVVDYWVPKARKNRKNLEKRGEQEKKSKHLTWNTSF